MLEADQTSEVDDDLPEFGEVGEDTLNEADEDMEEEMHEFDGEWTL